jgi:photosystem II stability/assembly factor-like uncharacterized protein
MVRAVVALWLAIPLVCAAAVNEFSTTGPYGGWSVLAAHPSSTGRAIAARKDTVYRTVDGGRTWTSTGALFAGGIVRAVAFDPSNADRTRIAVGSLLYRSDDGGITWSKGESLPLHYFTYTGSVSTISRLAVSPHAANDLYVTDGELAYSDDDGATFKTIGPPGEYQYVYDFAFHPAARNTIYAATQQWGFMLSPDNGVTWLPGTGLPPDYAGVRLAVAGNRLYLVLAHRNSAPTVRYGYDRYIVYVSQDGGGTWQPAGLTIDGTIPWTEIDLLPIPAQSQSILLRAGAILAISRDDGATWSNVTLPDDGKVHAIAADTHDLYASVIGYGIRRSSDGGTTWQRARGGLPAEAVNHIGSMGTTVLASTPDRFVPRPAELLRRTQDSNAWKTSLLMSYPAYGGFGQTGGTVFLSIVDGPYAFQGFFSVPGAPDAIAMTYDGHVLQSNDRGGSWSPVDGDATPAIERFAIASDGATVYGCGAGRPSATGWNWISGALARSRDSGKTWTKLVANPNFGCSAIVVEPGSRDTAYLSRPWDIGAGTLRTTDGGNTWTPVPQTQSEIVSALLIDPARPRILIAAIINPWAAMTIDAVTGDRDRIGDVLPAQPRSLALDVFTSPPTLFVGTANGVYARPAVAGPGPWTLLSGSQGLDVSELAFTFAPQAPTRRTLFAATSLGVREFTFDTANALVPVYRLFNAQTQSHFFTASADERNAVLAALPYFSDESIAFYGFLNPSPLVVPVHRFYRPALGTHAYATTDAERDALVASGAVSEGIAYHVLASAIQEPGTLAVHRFVNATTGGELFTTDDDERDDIQRSLPQFAYRGVAFTAYLAPTAR